MTTTKANPLGLGVWLRWWSTCTRPLKDEAKMTRSSMSSSASWSPCHSAQTSHHPLGNSLLYQALRRLGSLPVVHGMARHHGNVESYAALKVESVLIVLLMSHWTIISSGHAGLSQEEVLMPALELSVHLAFDDLRKMFLPQRGDWDVKTHYVSEVKF